MPRPVLSPQASPLLAGLVLLCPCEPLGSLTGLEPTDEITTSFEIGLDIM